VPVHGRHARRKRSKHALIVSVRFIAKADCLARCVLSFRFRTPRRRCRCSQALALVRTLLVSFLESGGYSGRRVGELRTRALAQITALLKACAQSPFVAAASAGCEQSGGKQSGGSSAHAAKGAAGTRQPDRERHDPTKQLDGGCQARRPFLVPYGWRLAKKMGDCLQLFCLFFEWQPGAQVAKVQGGVGPTINSTPSAPSQTTSAAPASASSAASADPDAARRAAIRSDGSDGRDERQLCALRSSAFQAFAQGLVFSIDLHADRAMLPQRSTVADGSTESAESRSSAAAAASGATPRENAQCPWLPPPAAQLTARGHACIHELRILVAAAHMYLSAGQSRAQADDGAFAILLCDKLKASLRDLDRAGRSKLPNGAAEGSGCGDSDSFRQDEATAEFHNYFDSLRRIHLESHDVMHSLCRVGESYHPTHPRATHPSTSP